MKTVDDTEPGNRPEDEPEDEPEHVQEAWTGGKKCVARF